MREEERCPKAGEFYRHFKNKLYQILTIATHSETGEKMVVYQALYGDYQVYVRPLDMFISEVDHEKYPDVEQTYRFERVMPKREEAVVTASKQDGITWHQIEAASAETEEWGTSIERQERQANPYLLEFLAADTYEEKLRALARMRGHVGQIELDSIALTLDIQPMRCDFQTQLDTFVKHVKMQQYYDGRRLR